MQIKIKNKGILDFHLEQTDEKKWELVTNDRSVDITLEWSGAAFTISESDKILIDADDQDLSLLLKQLAQQLSPFGSNGVEDENIEEESEEMEPFNPEEISIDPKVVPMDALLRRLVQKTIILNPDFQRNEVWDNVQKSRLIESLMLKIPIPMFYVSSDTKSVWSVVDGLQRMSTIRDFVLGKEYLKNPEKNKEKKGYGMKLSGLEFWGSKYDGKCFNELPLFLQNRIYETEFRFTVVNPGTPEEVKRNIFKRLNTGGAPLTSQEIRNALYTGNATMLLAQLAKEKAFLQATCGSIQPNRMLDYEIILRYISFLIRDYPSYNRTFGSDIWLSDTMIILNARPTYKLPEFQKRILKRTIAINTIKDLNDEKIKEVFVIAMKRAKLLFGKHAFRKSVPGMRRTPINKSLFESWGVLLGNMSEEHFSCLKRQEKVFFQEYGILLKTKAFEIAISRDSMRHTSVAFRYEELKKLLNKFYDNV